MRRIAAYIFSIILLASILSGCGYAAPSNGQANEPAVQTQTETVLSEPAKPLRTVAPAPTGSVQEEEPEPPESREVPDDSTFEIYFLDVGEGDSAVISCDGHAMIIDGGGSDSSSLVYSFLRNHGIDRLDYMVNTHPDADHVGGLSGALNYAQVDCVFCPVTSHDTKTFGSFLKYIQQQGLQITLPSAGDTFTLGSAEATMLSSGREKTETGNDSVVIRIVYGNTSFLFTGDAEEEQENTLVRNWGSGLESTLLKVGHHGSSTSTTQGFLNTVKPECSVISVGGRNEYGHPTVDVLANLASVGTTLFRTDMQGTIHCISDGESLTVEVEKNADLDTFGYDGGYSNALERAEMLAAAEAAEAQRSIADGESGGIDYIANTNSHKFHYPSCPSVAKMKESNKWYFHGTREELIDQGYKPCGNCHP